LKRDDGIRLIDSKLVLHILTAKHRERVDGDAAVLHLVCGADVDGGRDVAIGSGRGGTSPGLESGGNQESAERKKKDVENLLERKL
jgi:hypothetical protein